MEILLLVIIILFLLNFPISDNDVDGNKMGEAPTTPLQLKLLLPAASVDIQDLKTEYDKKEIEKLFLKIKAIHSIDNNTKPLEGLYYIFEKDVIGYDPVIYKNSKYDLLRVIRFFKNRKLSVHTFKSTIEDIPKILKWFGLDKNGKPKGETQYFTEGKNIIFNKDELGSHQLDHYYYFGEIINDESILFHRHHSSSSLSHFLEETTDGGIVDALETFLYGKEVLSNKQFSQVKGFLESKQNDFLYKKYKQ